MSLKLNKKVLLTIINGLSHINIQYSTLCINWYTCNVAMHKDCSTILCTVAIPTLLQSAVRQCLPVCYIQETL